MRFPFCGASYSSQSTFVDHQRTVNWYPEVTESGTSAARIVLYPTPGFASVCTLPTSPVRCLFASNARAFAVAGAAFYELLPTAPFYYSYGTVANDGLPATISSNGDAGHQLWIVSGGSGYVFDLITNTFSGPLRTDAGMGAFLDGYFLSLDTNLAKLYLSALEDGLTWDETDVAQRNTTPDRWVSMIVSHREIWLFGKQRIDIWGNSGAALFPFEPVSGAFVEQGIAAPSSAALIDNTVMWLGENEQGSAMVWRASGYTPARVSHHALEYAMQGYATVADAVAFTYQDQGHAFYVLTFPTADATWVYDCATNLWHERGHWNASTGRYERWMPRFHAYAFGKHLVGDGASGAIAEMSIAYATDADGSPIRRMRQAPHLLNDHRWMFYHEAELLLETGLGSLSVRDPQIGLQWSDDAGHTWSTIRWVSAGQAGQYATRPIWRRLGRSRDRIFRVIADDGVPWRILDLLIGVEAGTT